MGRKPTILHLLRTRFREMKGSVDFERIEKEFRYTKECMGLIKERGKAMAKEFSNSKEEQKENIREFLVKSTDSDVLLFTDGSALNNPGPTGAGADIMCILMFITMFQSLTRKLLPPWEITILVSWWGSRKVWSF